MTTYNIQKYEGFKHLDPKMSDYEKAVTGIFNEMKLRQHDEDVEYMRKNLTPLRGKKCLKWREATQNGIISLF